MSTFMDITNNNTKSSFDEQNQTVSSDSTDEIVCGAGVQVAEVETVAKEVVGSVAKEVVGSVAKEVVGSVVAIQPTNEHGSNGREQIVSNQSGPYSISCVTYKMGGSSGYNESGVRVKENQDGTITLQFKFKDLDYVLTIVVDGHGIFGRWFANQVIKDFPKLIFDNFEQILAEPHFLKPLFRSINDKLRIEVPQYIQSIIDMNPTLSRFTIESIRDPTATGGTTCTVVIQGNGLQITANVSDGESMSKFDCDPQAITIVRDGVELDKPTTQTVLTTESHDLDNMVEVKRLLEQGAYVSFATHNNSGLFRAYELNADGSLKTNSAPSKCFYNCASQKLAKYATESRYDTGGINMSRTLGDFSKKFILCEPTVTVIQFPMGTRVRTISATDGSWNAFDTRKQSVIDNLFSGTHDQIYERIHSEVHELFGTYGDNTTISIVDYQP